jgi:hypothetical protein
MKKISVRNLGPILEADMEFGDLTVVVGPQASGKSILLQTLKLVMDRAHVHDTFGHYSTVFNKDAEAFLSAFYGRGMGGMIRNDPAPTIVCDGKMMSLADLAKRGRPKRKVTEKLFYIPAQRVVSLPGGKTAPFGSFEFGDPYVLRYFADRLHILMQNEFASKLEIFPSNNRLNESLRRPIEQHFFGNARLELKARAYTKSLSLKIEGLNEGLPYLAWSAGQREFAPLLLGLYWLCPAGGSPTRDDLEWVVIEEPEMGLHPRAIATTLLLVLELMRRGYKVVLSTHSPVVLDLIWAVRLIKKHEGSEKDILKLFDLPSKSKTKALSARALAMDARVYFFERGKPVYDISTLDPFDGKDEVASWGGLTAFSGRSGEIVAEVVARFESKGGCFHDL